MLRGSLALSACRALAAGAAGCATQRPVLYPGQQVYSTPPEVVEADVEGCLDRGAATGGATGAAAGLVRGILRAGQPDPAQQRFVETCLRDKGYRVAGWR